MQQNSLYNNNINKILIVGANGNLGRCVSDHLVNMNYNIECPKKESLDLSKPHSFRLYLNEHHEYDVLINLAFFSSKFTSKDYVFKENCIIVNNIIECSHRFKQIIHFGSSAEYNSICSKNRIVESMSYASPKDLYGRCKYYANSFFSKLDNCVILRLFPCFGSNNYIDKLICRIIYSTNEMEMGKIVENDIRTNYLYVGDLVKVIEFLLHNRIIGDTFNICNDDCVSRFDLRNLILKKMGKMSMQIPNNYSCQEITGDNRKILAKIEGMKFKSIYNYVDGLMNFIPFPKKQIV